MEDLEDNFRDTHSFDFVSSLNKFPIIHKHLVIVLVSLFAKFRGSASDFSAEVL